MLYNKNMKQEYMLNFPDKLLSNRICIALTKLGLNEFYVAFKYLHKIIEYVIIEQNDNRETISNSIKMLENKYQNTERTIINALGKIFTLCNPEVFKSSHLYGKIKLNYYHKIKIIKDYVLKEINKDSMNL